MKTKEQKTTIRYSYSFKQMIVKEVESGSTFDNTRKKYDIKGDPFCKIHFRANVG
ncbi:MAG: hypothetical protein ABIN48_15480 [Ginsengibacter sp.]